MTVDTQDLSLKFEDNHLLVQTIQEIFTTTISAAQPPRTSIPGLIAC